MKNTGTIFVRHYIQMGHRLWRHTGKCQCLHGHTWLCELSVTGPINNIGMVIDYYDVKQAWHGWLDKELDHHFMFAHDDPLITAVKDPQDGSGRAHLDVIHEVYPGAILVPFHPTSENIAGYMLGHAQAIFGSEYTCAVSLMEGEVNGTRASSPQ